MKGKSAEKSPQDESAPTKIGGGDAAELNQKITDQGNKVRQLKGQKAAKVLYLPTTLLVTSAQLETPIYGT